jgi:hypothetical protein
VAGPKDHRSAIPVESWAEETFTLEVRRGRRKRAASEPGLYETEPVGAADDPFRFRLDRDPEPTVEIEQVATPDPHC